jgi:hypothetical protein
MHGWGFAGLVCLPILFVQGDLAAQLETDVNIATDLDISASVGRDEEWLERFGTARGRPPEPFQSRPAGPPWPGRRRRLTEVAVYLREADGAVGPDPLGQA